MWRETHEANMLNTLSANRPVECKQTLELGIALKEPCQIMPWPISLLAFTSFVGMSMIRERKAFSNGCLGYETDSKILWKGYRT